MLIHVGVLKRKREIIVPCRGEKASYLYLTTHPGGKCPDSVFQDQESYEQPALTPTLIQGWDCRSLTTQASPGFSFVLPKILFLPVLKSYPWPALYYRSCTIPRLRPLFLSLFQPKVSPTLMLPPSLSPVRSIHSISKHSHLFSFHAKLFH